MCQRFTPRRCSAKKKTTVIVGAHLGDGKASELRAAQKRKEEKESVRALVLCSHFALLHATLTRLSRYRPQSERSVLAQLSDEKKDPGFFRANHKLLRARLHV